MDLQAKLDPFQTRIEQWRSAHFFYAIAVPLFLLFFLTSSRGLPYQIDGLTNALTAWQLGTHGTVYLDDYAEFAGDEYYGGLILLVSSDEHTVSKYPPGTAALVAPAYFIAQSQTTLVTGEFMDQELGELRTTEIALPSLVPAAIVASLTTAIALGLFGLVFRSLASPWMALTGAYLAGLGTSAWSVAADLLWQHGPAMMFLALALLMMDRERHVLAGLAFGFAVLVRPQTAVIVAVTGIITALYRRSWKTLFQVGAAASLGTALYLSYNFLVFGAADPIPEPAGYFTKGLTGSSVVGDLGDFVLAFFDPQRGVLVWSPFLLVLVPGLFSAWKAAPGWVKGAAAGGLFYLVVQVRGNSFAGGSGFFSYRYQLEMLVAAAPILLISYREWVAHSAVRVKVFQWGAVASIAAHTVGATMG